MSSFSSDDLARIGGADEIGISSERADGSARPFVTIWAVRAGDALFVRSAHGTDNPWYRRAVGSGTGRIRVGSVEHDVSFATIDADDPLQDAVDAAYHAKYDRYGPRIVGSVVGPKAHPSTLRLDPR